MGWITRQTRPDVLVNVSMAAQLMGKRTVRGVLDLNKGVKMLKESSDAVWSFRTLRDQSDRLRGLHLC